MRRNQRPAQKRTTRPDLQQGAGVLPEGEVVAGSILVSFADCEEGPKNPLFGIPVNPVVSASYAQSGVDAVGRRFCACGGRAVSNGMEKMTRSLWRLDIVQRRTPFAVSDRCTIPDMNLHCGATRL